MKYNEYTSVCDNCNGRGWFEKITPCTREMSIPCECCGSYENAKLVKCTGKNVLIDYSDISRQFVSFYENGQRVKVKLSTGEIKSGTIGKTTGWKPMFMLLLRSSSTGSSILLTDNDKII